MCDRILVMHHGQVKREILDVPHATQEDILSVSVT
jgi:ABC-type sugar transport system ATPase subunit